MARAKKTTKKSAINKTVKKNKKTAEKKELKVAKTTNQKFYDQLKLSESYISLILGAVVVIGVSAIFFIFIKESKKTTVPQAETIKTTISPVLSKTPQKTHVITENESLWDVAVNEYGDGYKYVDIIEANKDKIENPDFVPPGTVIIIPQ